MRRNAAEKTASTAVFLTGWRWLFDSREDAIIWICKNQTGRRNISDEQRAYLLGKQYAAQKKVHGSEKGGRGNQYTDVVSAQNEHIPSRTVDKVAAEMGVGKETVKRAEKFANAVDILAQADPEIKPIILSGKTNAPKIAVISGYFL